VKLGELFFEQVLIGLVVLGVLGLPFAPELMSQAKVSDISTILGVAGGAVILGVAFILGLVFDRVADSLADRLDTHNRLCYTLRQEKPRQPDPYPEDAYRVAVLKLEKDVVVWMNYHRSRIRVARALMVYGPAVALAAVVGAARIVVPQHVVSSPLWLLAVPLTYIGAGWAITTRQKLPKTYQDLTAHAGRYRRLIHPRDDADAAAPSAGRILLGEPLVLSETILSVLTLVLAIATGRVSPIVTGVAVVALTVLSAWTWWRISMTYRGYLQKAAESKASKGEVERAA
jgi:aromatic ring-cleaving dioxygenase